MGSAEFCPVTHPMRTIGSDRIMSLLIAFSLNDRVWRTDPKEILPPKAIARAPDRITYLPQTWEPEVQTKGTVMPVQQVV